MGSCSRSQPSPKQHPVSVASHPAPLAAPSRSVSTPLGSARRADKDEPPEAAAPEQHASGRWVVDELADVGPAGPCSATRDGVVCVTRDGDLLLARLKGPLPKGRKSGRTRLEPVQAEATSLVASGVGPAMVGGAAYFVSHGRLVRRRLAGASGFEVLAPDAREGSRVAAATALPGHDEGPAMVAYLARATGRLVAKLWVEGAGVRELSPEGTSISSVALARAGNDLMALSLEGRTSMSPLHARKITPKNGGIELGADVVVWVGGGAAQLTDLTAIGTASGDVHGFLPIERDMTHFGLARIEVDAEPHMDADVSWRNYPNGIEPAVTAGAWVCGAPILLYARPADATPHAPEELHLASVGDTGLGPSEVAARARLIINLSMAPLPEGALVSYVADKRAWAFTIRCGKGS
jgi:hypothetical protein